VQDDEIARDVERASGSEHGTGKLGAHKLRAASACAMHDEDGIAYDAGGIAFRLAEGSVVIIITCCLGLRGNDGQSIPVVDSRIYKP
jgi:hypothetical protein